MHAHIYIYIYIYMYIIHLFISCICIIFTRRDAFCKWQHQAEEVPFIVVPAPIPASVALALVQRATCRKYIRPKDKGGMVRHYEKTRIARKNKIDPSKAS